MLPAGVRALGQRIAAATYRHFETCLSAVPEPARGQLQEFGAHLANPEQTSLVAKVLLLLAYDLGARDEQVLTRINNASALGAMHSQILDEVVDNKGVGPRAALQNVYLAHIVFNFYFESLARIRDEPPTFAELAAFRDIEIETCGALFEEEARHVGVPSAFDSQRSVASKAAPVKAVVLQILALTGRQDLRELLFPAVEDCSFALLLADDIVDWEQDYDLRRFTYPVQAALDRLHATWSPDQHATLKPKVARTLFLSPLYHELMKDMVDKLALHAARLERICPTLSGLMAEHSALALKKWRGHAKWLYAMGTAAGASSR